MCWIAEDLTIPIPSSLIKSNEKFLSNRSRKMASSDSPELRPLPAIESTAMNVIFKTIWFPIPIDWHT